jgi:putative membrane protein
VAYVTALRLLREPGNVVEPRRILGFMGGPLLYNAALEVRALHALMHVSFVVSAALGWWPIMSPLPELPRLAPPLQMLYVLVLGAPMVVVAALITLAPTVLYPHYGAAPRLWGLDALADQRAGGAIMWVPGHVVFVIPFTLAFFRWAREERDDDSARPVGDPELSR